ncbi:hypothetical protein WMY93_001585 [Mugilogobius chulae]|uniref:ribonuclease H n=1 Tax=Mugilogobius chulae TaxID=88201 RepID=A0AAW0PTU1_9GOBI
MRCYFTTTPFSTDLMRNVVKLWQLDTFPRQNEKEVTRSKQDQYALALLDSKTQKVNLNGQWRYATPLLRHPQFPTLRTELTSFLPVLLRTESRLKKNTAMSEVHSREIEKLLEAGYVVPVNPKQTPSAESWFLPHHVVTQHGDKHRLVFNCSYNHQGQSLNDCLLPGPVLGPSLLGVLLRFRQHQVAVIGDIKAMFHQVRLLPEDSPLLRFLWRYLKPEEPTVYEWRVLPFGTTCSPCCAIYALQRHARDHLEPENNLRQAVEQSFYVDNCLQSFTSADAARRFVEDLSSCDLWLSHTTADPQEPTLGLRWNCRTDVFSYKCKTPTLAGPSPTLREIYRILASQYDPLGYILPFLTQAKILVQDLWNSPRGWDDPIEDSTLASRWNSWHSELALLPQVNFPRCYESTAMELTGMTRELHVFCDSSERAYGSVAYLRSEDCLGQVSVSFVMSRSRVAPRKQISMPRLELCAAVSGAQLAALLQKEIGVPIQQVSLWSDSTTVLQWLQSDSCRYKVFVGTRIAEIQDLTSPEDWKYVDSALNPADDLTRGKTLSEIVQPQRWSLGPSFLFQDKSQWPKSPTKRDEEREEDLKEVKITRLLALSAQPASSVLDISTCSTWKDAVDAAIATLDVSTANPAVVAELVLLRQAQLDSFPSEVSVLQVGKSVPPSSRLCPLAPEYDPALQLIRVGGRLRRAADLDPDVIHPIVLDSDHQVAKLLIKEYDERLLHPGSERLFAELRRKYWLIRGRSAVRQHQRLCQLCQKWRASPDIPKMADLPPARLRLFKPAFWSTGIDCFGPFYTKVGRRTEKCWGVIFKCMTTRCVHLDLLESLDADAFLMALRRFVARRGQPYEIFADCGTNFRGAYAELKRAFKDMIPDLQEQLQKQQILFHFNPPAAPHFGGLWEREIKSIKDALRVVLANQTVPPAVLQTVLIEVEGILNSKPLGYVSADVADPDPVTPNLLLMGQRDASLPQAVYASNQSIGKRRWRHSQILADHFWTNFVRHHLPDLQPRSKWKVEKENLKCGQVVMIVDPQLPRSSWPVGKVVEIFPGADGRVRSAKVNVKQQVYLRPVARLIQLPEVKDDGE